MDGRGLFLSQRLATLRLPPPKQHATRAQGQATRASSLVAFLVAPLASRLVSGVVALLRPRGVRKRLVWLAGGKVEILKLTRMEVLKLTRKTRTGPPNFEERGGPV